MNHLDGVAAAIVFSKIERVAAVNEQAFQHEIHWRLTTREQSSRCFETRQDTPLTLKLLDVAWLLM